MVFYRRRFRRTRQTRRYPRRYAKGRKRSFNLAKKVSYLMKQNKVNRPELKFNDDLIDGDAIWTTPVVVKLGPDAGGGRITFKSIYMKGNLQLQSSTLKKEFYRIVIFTDKSNEGSAIPAFTDVFKTASVDSLRAIAHGKNEGQRFKVLYDRTYSLVLDSDAQLDDAIHFKFYKKLFIKSINVDDYWEKGGLYLGFIGTTAEAVCDLTLNIRTRYVQQNDD